MEKNSVFRKDKKYIANTYNRYPMVVSHAKGKYVWDTAGKKYLDFFCGLSVTGFGHCHPAVVKAVRKQAGRFMHVSNLYYTSPQLELAGILVKLSIGGKVFFSNSGAEANECAVKAARKWGKHEKAGAHEIIIFKNSFHGRTIGTLSATGQEKHKKEFTPLLQGFRQAEFNDINSVKKLIGKKTCAVLVEVVQGEGGVNVARADFLEQLYKLSIKENILSIFDEVQTGFGRTGRVFAWQHFRVKPDIITMAKAAGGGLPMGITVLGDKVKDTFETGEHGSTFGANPVCVAAALANAGLLNENVLRNARDKGSYLKDRLEKLKFKYPGVIKDVRGLGLMLAAELSVSEKIIKGRAFVCRCLERGLLINCTQDCIIRLMPPLTISKADADSAVKIMDGVFEKYGLRS